MAGKTNTKQICVFKTTKSLLEFMDDTRYSKDAMAWPHTTMSRIRINAKDYSKGIGDLAVDAFYNLSPDEFYRFHLAVQRARASVTQDISRLSRQLERLDNARQTYPSHGANIKGLEALKDMAKQFADSSNEVFSEAGEKLMKLIKGLGVSSEVQNTGGLDKLIEDTKRELESAKSGKEVFSDIKILNYDKYINPENNDERRVTMLKLLYVASRNYPYNFTIANGWGVPLITKNKGVVIKEGSTRFTETVNISMDEKSLLPMLRRVETFLQAMTFHGLASYFENVSNPVLFYQMEESDN